MVDADGASEARGEVLLALLLGGRLSRSEIRTRAGLSSAQADSVLRALESTHLLEAGVPPDGLRRYRLTPTGRARGEEVVRADRAAIGPAIEALIDRFDETNGALKELLRQWQLRPEGSAMVVNDHTDAAYDDRLLAQLGQLLARAEAWLTDLPSERARYERYGRRLRHAVDRAGRGELEYVAGLSVDSVHAVWWQLHADLLAVLGRERSAADA